ncbi:MAG: ABC transporter substrate-binding protein [Spirochaetales bacterium]|nr:ABC transporter substrate-binding protein [Spirochaetales bacterium]
MMRTRLFHIILLLVGASPLFGGGSQESATESQTRIVIDGLRREVEIPVEFDRVVTIPIPLASVFTTVDGTGERVVGMHPASYSAVEGSILGTIAPELLAADTSFITEGFQVNIEELLILDPDIVFQWARQTEEIEKIEAAGIPVIAVGGGGQDFRSVRDWLILAGEVTGRTERLQALLDHLEETEHRISQRVEAVPLEERLRAMALHVPPLQARAYDWIETVGGINVAVDMPRWISEIDIEQLYAWDPEVIVLSNFVDTQPEDLYANRIEGYDFAPLNAVRERRVYKIPMGAYRWDPPSQESGLMLWWLAKTFYPDRFSDIDVEREIEDFYRRFYDYTPTDEEIASILASPGTEYWRGFR